MKRKIENSDPLKSEIALKRAITFGRDFRAVESRGRIIIPLLTALPGFGGANCFHRAADKLGAPTIVPIARSWCRPRVRSNVISSRSARVWKRFNYFFFSIYQSTLERVIPTLRAHERDYHSRFSCDLCSVSHPQNGHSIIVESLYYRAR